MEDMERIIIRRSHMAAEVEAVRVSILKAEKVTKEQLDEYDALIYEYSELSVKVQMWLDSLHPFKAWLRKLLA